MSKEIKIRVLVVDDSALMRKKISEMINADEHCEVIGTARDGEEAIRSVATLRPDVVTLDLELPRMDGITALQYIMSEWPTPIIIVSAYRQYRGMDVIQCLEYGAVDLVAKPSGVISRDVVSVKDELLGKIRSAAKVNLRVLRPYFAEGVEGGEKPKFSLADKMVAIASSTGGPRALMEILPKLDANIPAGILVLQHMPEGFTESMAQRMDGESKIRVREAKDGDCLREAEVLVARGGFQLTLDSAGKNGVNVQLSRGAKMHGVAPCADITMKSLAPLFGKKCLGVVLTGMGWDGAEGLRAIKRFGGSTMAQDAATSVVYGMPKAAVDAGLADKVLPLAQMAQAIMSWARAA